ncbi:MAG: phage Gp37/Gp68 family protein, partial [Coriobacteriales bacterium]|nr:phage Gp37/Gp68 family protein [Coriobacteriales bacterium]
MASWNPWHGCRKFSPGCLNCYVYRMDDEFGRDPAHFALTSSYLLP